MARDPLALSLVLALALGLTQSSAAAAAPPPPPRPSSPGVPGGVPGGIPGGIPGEAAAKPEIDPFTLPPQSAPDEETTEVEAGPYPGRVNRDAVAAFIAGRFSQIDVCAARARADEPNLMGEITIWMAISTDGSIPDVRIQSTTIQNRVLLSCIIATAKTWQVSPAQGGMAQLAYTFEFASTAGPSAAGWHTKSGAVAVNAKYPDTPSLGQAGRPPREVPDGGRARRWGWGLFLSGYIVGAIEGAESANAVWLIPVLGPVIGGSMDQDVLDLGAFLSAVQLTGVGLLTLGYVKRASWKRERESAWQGRHMRAYVGPSRGGVRASFGMSF